MTSLFFFIFIKLIFFSAIGVPLYVPKKTWELAPLPIISLEIINDSSSFIIQFFLEEFILLSINGCISFDKVS